MKYLILSVLLISSIQAEIQEIKLRVSGFVNEYCAQGIERRLEKLADVKNVNVSKKGSVKIELEDNNKFNLLKLKPAIEARTTYKVKSMKIIASGKIKPVNQYFALEMDESPTKIFLTKTQFIKKKSIVVSTKKAYDKTMNFFKGMFGPTYQSEKDLVRSMRLHCKHNADVRFEGKVHAQADGSIWLSKCKAKITEIDDDSELFVQELSDVN